MRGVYGLDENNIKKRNTLVDVILLTSIFSAFLAIIFIVFFHSKEETIQQGRTNTFTIPKSETSEMDSPFSNIKIITDVSNDDYAPFAIQYPYTIHENVNEVITNFITEEKNTYIQKMRLKKGDIKIGATGELNVSFEIFQHKDNFYSFLIKTVQSLPNEKRTESYTTYFLNNEDGKIFTFKQLLSDNKESLKTVASHTYSLLKEDNRYTHLHDDEIKEATKTNWSNFSHFVIHDDVLEFYFNNLIEKNTNIPTNVPVPLTLIDSLLIEQVQLTVAQPNENLGLENNEARKLVALTFDDGPNPDVTPQILELLKRYDAQATFFMLGSRVQYYPEIVKSIYDQGHEIGNHTWNHPQLTKMSEAQILKEYSSTEQAIIQAIGVPSTVFRAPYGASNSLVKNTIDSSHVLWSIDTEDWKHRSANKILPYVENSMHNNAIILMHDIHQSTADGLESVLKFLQNAGYEFVTVSEVVQYK